MCSGAAEKFEASGFNSTLAPLGFPLISFYPVAAVVYSASQSSFGRDNSHILQGF